MSRTGVTFGVAAVLAAFVGLPAPGKLDGARRTFAAVTAGLSPDSISGVSGQLSTVDLQVNLGSTGKSLASYSATITWDSTVVRLDSVRPGAFGPPVLNFVSGGEVRLTWVNASGQSGAFTLAQLFFRFVNDTIGKRTNLQASFTDLAATDFTDLRTDLATISGVARILPPSVFVRFAPDSMAERAGHGLRVDLTADLPQAAGVALGSYVASVTWDPTILALDSVGAGTHSNPEVNLVSSSELRLAGASALGGASASPSLARMFFRFVSTTLHAQTALGLGVSEMRAAGTFANLLPGVTSRNGKALIGVLRGDIDIGGAVAALDAQLILQGVVGLALPGGAAGVPNGDADCNGALQAKDAQIVLNLVVSNDVSQFCAGRIQ